MTPSRWPTQVGADHLMRMCALVVEQMVELARLVNGGTIESLERQPPIPVRHRLGRRARAGELELTVAAQLHSQRRRAVDRRPRHQHHRRRAWVLGTDRRHLDPAIRRRRHAALRPARGAGHDRRRDRRQRHRAERRLGHDPVDPAADVRVPRRVVGRRRQLPRRPGRILRAHPRGVRDRVVAPGRHHRRDAHRGRRPRRGRGTRRRPAHVAARCGGSLRHRLAPSIRSASGYMSSALSGSRPRSTTRSCGGGATTQSAMPNVRPRRTTWP